MSHNNPNGEKGARWEVRLVGWLAENGFPLAERRAKKGRLDTGDVSGVPFVIEAKNCRTIDLSGWCDEAAKEAQNAGMGNRWAVVMPRRSHVTAKAYAVISLELLAELMRLARNAEQSDTYAANHATAGDLR